jgi:CheY-like chemotaxis protein
MARAQQASRKRSRARHSSAKALRARLVSQALDLEMPLTDTMNLVHALRAIGDGMLADNDDRGRPVVAVALAAKNRIEDLKQEWCKLLDIAKLRKALR